MGSNYDYMYNTINCDVVQGHFLPAHDALHCGFLISHELYHSDSKSTKISCYSIQNVKVDEKGSLIQQVPSVRPYQLQIRLLNTGLRILY